MNDPLEQLQIKIAFLERANADLSDVVFRQQQELRVLALRVDHLSDRLEAGDSEERRRPLDDERPPHY
jgi:uncharacterized coiled-coil protein SlyX